MNVEDWGGSMRYPLILILLTMEGSMNLFACDIVAQYIIVYDVMHGDIYIRGFIYNRVTIT